MQPKIVKCEPDIPKGVRDTGEILGQQMVNVMSLAGRARAVSSVLHGFADEGEKDPAALANSWLPAMLRDLAVSLDKGLEPFLPKESGRAAACDEPVGGR